MLRILHISDSHAQFETMQRLNRLALDSSDCQVVAHTGDCVSSTQDELPSEWDRWPQPAKLSVPGDHYDHSRTFVNLRNWVHDAPWVTSFEDVVFVGLDLQSGLGAPDYLRSLLDTDLPPARAVALLSHFRPRFLVADPLTAALTELLKDRPLLLLHGHEQPGGFEAEWDPNGTIDGRRYWRSNVCSSPLRRTRRGLAHQIEWSSGRFKYVEVQGQP